ncbi:MAG: hypothetical protein HYZ48_05240 [Chlamydiales bacterium]|nr:hypothetical protein [Chlamydiales bacterium]
MAKIVTSIKNTPAIFHLGAMVNLVLGLIIVSQFNMWSASITVLVTLLGWGMILRGVMALFVPQMLIKIMMGKSSNMKTWSFITLIWGILLSWLAFWM